MRKNILRVSGKSLWQSIHGFTLACILAGTSLAANRLEIQMVPMLKLTGEVGETNQIQYTTDLGQSSGWKVLTNIVMTQSPEFFVDTNAAGAVKRYYQSVTIKSPPGMVYIPAGTFTMGSPTNDVDRYSGESPQTEVTISQGFWMSQYETTQEEYLAVIGSNPSHFTGDLKRPVENVSWNDATNYCAMLTARERAAGRLAIGYMYRLPTEAEWEYCCRAGTTTRFSYGDDLDYTQLGNYAWYDLNSDKTTHPVGEKLPNAWGLYDMYGNVYECCLDCLGTYSGESVTDPQGPNTGSIRVFRGGGWRYRNALCRSASRDGDSPEGRYDYLGFRPVLVRGQ